MDVALISDLVIDPTNSMVACSSDKGTVHIFSIGAEENKNTKSALSAFGGYFNSEWSFAKLAIKDANSKVAIFD